MMVRISNSHRKGPDVLLRLAVGHTDTIHVIILKRDIMARSRSIRGTKLIS